jgi:hypothetical protein
MDRRLVPVVCALLVTTVAIIVGSTFVKFYNERTENYKKHLFVLHHECRSGRQLPQIQYNMMTYDGTSTNCTEALVFTSIWPGVGAIHDMWVASPFYALMYATDWKIQIAYVVFGLAIIYFGLREYFRAKAQKAVLDTFSSTQSNIRMAKSSIDQRPRLLVKVTPEQEEMDQLAKKIISAQVSSPPLFQRCT